MGPEEPHRAPETTVLSGRLHPATILLDTAKLIRVFGLLVLYAAFEAWRGRAGVLVIYGVMLAVGMVFSFVVPMLGWLRFRWRLTSEALEVTSGILRSSVRRIPLSRIQNLGLKAGLFHRALGVVVVSVETSSTAKAEAELDAMSRADADALARALGVANAGAALADRASIPPASPALETALVRLRTIDLVKRGLTDNRAGFLVAGALTFVERFAGPGDEGLLAFLGAVYERIVPALGGSVLIEVLFGTAVVVAIWALGYLASVVFNLLLFHGFTLRVEDGVFIRQHGLFTRVRQSVPRHRIQALRMHQSWLRRAIGIASLEAHDMGASADAQSTRRTGKDVFIPVASPERIRALVPLVFPAFSEGELIWRPVSTRLVRRTTTMGLLAGLTCALALFTASEGASALVRVSAFVLVPVCASAAWLYGRAAHRALRFASTGAFFAIRRGVLGRDEVVVPSARMQSIEVARTPLDRFHGVATLAIVVGGGETLRLGNLAVDEARSLAGSLAASADLESAKARVAPLAMAPA
jgi:putative membrane protein